MPNFLIQSTLIEIGGAAAKFGKTPSSELSSCSHGVDGVCGRSAPEERVSPLASWMRTAATFGLLKDICRRLPSAHPLVRLLDTSVNMTCYYFSQACQTAIKNLF